MLDTAWIIATGGSLFCLCSFIILKISSFSPNTMGPTSDAELCDQRIVIYRENKGSVGRGFVLQVQSDDIDVNGNLDLSW